ncbi:carbohydrate-binding family 9-like protein [Paenibacillus sp. MWE-103]|uniref:Carbohydrate-binding family 9-like protein n=1 Tax=Paenibacillus artemisiicola TaxID=1172618 RepID=A0ABS3WH64_9BACL|nr:carbohydrate-binding family 9-like protein [Paenibacillus artemisiicola]MBO7747490.1 carbohydrate-binding family 9-like protein [Paenibacillus artemisiicola]
MKLGEVPEPKIDYNPKHYLCKRAPGALAVDGRVDKPFWEAADWTDDFVDIEGGLRPKPAKRTRAKMLWDDDYFYFAAELEEDQIWATQTERDSVIFRDNDFEIFIDPDGDTHGYYEFEINALNTVWDLLLPKPYRDGGPAVNGWDIAGLKTAVHIEGELNRPGADNRKWSVEVAMPWNSLKEYASEGRRPVAGDYWRVNFSRVEWRAEARDGEYRKTLNPDTGRPYPEDNWVWSPMGLVNMHYPELWGIVAFADANGPFSFAPPADERIKWALRRLYYKARNYRAVHGVYPDGAALAADREAWGIASAIEAAIETTRSLFQFTAPSADGSAVYCIREDGKLWKESV